MRVEGDLALSRAFGDKHLKKYVPAEPDILDRTLEDGDEWLLLASDGLWDVMSSQEAVDLLGRHANGNGTGGPMNDTAAAGATPQAKARELVAQALRYRFCQASPLIQLSSTEVSPLLSISSHSSHSMLIPPHRCAELNTPSWNRRGSTDNVTALVFDLVAWRRGCKAQAAVGTAVGA